MLMIRKEVKSKNRSEIGKVGQNFRYEDPQKDKNFILSSVNFEIAQNFRWINSKFEFSGGELQI